MEEFNIGASLETLEERLWGKPGEQEANQLSSFTPPIDSRKTGKLELSSIADILNSPKPEYLINPFLYKGTVCLLTAYAGLGKSLVALSIAHAVVTGERLWVNFPVSQKGGVLIVDEENPSSFLCDRLIRMGFTPDMPLYFLHYQGVKLDDANCLNQLIGLIKEKKPVLVILDALIRLHSAKENDNSEMAGVMGKIRDIVNKTGVTVLVIHHDKKGLGEKRERARGSSDIVGAVDGQICLEAKEDELLLSPGKCRMSPFRPIRLKINNDADKLNFICLGNEVSEAESTVSDIVEILGSASMGIEDIAQGLKSRGDSIGTHRLRGILKNATGKELMADKGERGRLTYRVKSYGDGKTTRNAGTLDNKRTEASFPVCQGYTGGVKLESWKAGETLNLDVLEVLI